MVSTNSASAVTLSSSTATGTESLFSSSVGSSSISVRGPGSLAGKFISNLGKITLKGVEAVAIYGTLYTIGLEASSSEMYSDVLELSRPGMYSDIIHMRAMKFLVKQIASGRTRHLVNALKNWHSIEVRLLLSELIARFDEAIQSPFRPIGSIMQAYKQSLPTPTIADSDHSFIPFISFLRSLVSVAPSSFFLSFTILEAGLLDFLLHLYATDFRDPLAPLSSHTEYPRRSTLSVACNSLLIAACQSEEDGTITAYIQGHSIYALWPMHPALSLFSHHGETYDYNAQRILRRREAWHHIEKRWIYWRISSIHNVMADFASRHFEDGILKDAFVDLVQFAGSDLFNDEQLAFRALRSLHQLLQHTEPYLQDEHALVYATRIVQRLSSLVEDPFHSYFFFDFDTLLFRQTVVVHFIQWISRIASADVAFRHLMVHSGILELIKLASLSTSTL
ncbi:hypothetical protein VKT23_016001 [Stygiomarasmius scandens]|uniref:Uncharacterized protein n=1 Tax=Marasmiellus scandens TaxID=2682957 RepID=A0ABR1IWC4_9AGAR